MKNEIIYPGNRQQPCIAKYEIKHKNLDVTQSYRVEVIIYELFEKNPGATNVNHPSVFEYIVNKILKNEFNGVELRFIEFYYVREEQGHDIMYSTPYKLDKASLVRNGGKYTAIYHTTTGRIKAWLFSLFGKTVIPDVILYRSYDVTAGTSEVHVENYSHRLREN